MIQNANPSVIIPMSERVARLQDLGANAARFDSFQQHTDLGGGNYDMTGVLADRNAVTGAGMTALVLLNKIGGLPSDAAGQASFNENSRRVLVALGITNTIYEGPGNEPGLNGLTAAQFRPFLRDWSVVMKTQRSAAFLISAGLPIAPGGDAGAKAYLAEVLDQTAADKVDVTKLDAIGFHPYTGADKFSTPILPESTPSRLVGIRPASPAAGYNKTVINTEQGISAVECSGATLTDKEARAYKHVFRNTLAAIREPGYAFMYTLYDDGPATDAGPESHFGMYAYDRVTLKPQGLAFQRVMAMKNAAVAVQVLQDAAAKVYRYIFTYADGSADIVDDAYGSDFTPPEAVAGDSMGPLVYRLAR